MVPNEPTDPIILKTLIFLILLGHKANNIEN